MVKKIYISSIRPAISKLYINSSSIDLIKRVNNLNGVQALELSKFLHSASLKRKEWKEVNLTIK